MVYNTVLFVEIVLLDLLKSPQIRRAVLDFPRTLAGLYLALSAPPVHIAPSEHGVCLSLAHHLRVIPLPGELPCDLNRHIMDECVVGYGLVGKINRHHCFLLLGVVQSGRFAYSTYRLSSWQ